MGLQAQCHVESHSTCQPACLSPLPTIARDSPLAKKLEEHLSLPPAEVKGARYDPLSAAAPVYDSLAALLRTTNPPLPSKSALSE